MVDWSDYLEEGRLELIGHSRMRMYIAVGLIGIGMLGLIGGLLHVLPA